MSVWGALGAMIRPPVYAGRAVVGAAKQAGELGILAGTTGVKVAKEVFKKTEGTMLQNLQSAQVIPFKLKKKYAYGALLGMTAVGTIGGTIDGRAKNSSEVINDANVPYADIPGTLNRVLSPEPKRIDDMGADGNLVIAAHRNR